MLTKVTGKPERRKTVKKIQQNSKNTTETNCNILINEYNKDIFSKIFDFKSV